LFAFVIRYYVLDGLSPALLGHVLLFLLVLVCNIGIGVLTFGDQLTATMKEVPMEVIDKIVCFGVLSTMVTEVGAVTPG
jgi:hypothetical protein